MIELNADNYYSPEANRDYMSVSQVKQFMACPAAAMAALRGEYVRPATSALLIGSYVDAYFEGTLAGFRDVHPEIFKRDGSLKSEYERAQVMCGRAGRDGFFMEYMRGEKQRIVTGEIDGAPFKAKFDVYLPGQRIVDLKTTRDFAPRYKAGSGLVSFIEAWGYDLQMAVYQYLEGHKLPCYIAAISREAEPDIAVIEIPQYYMDAALAALRGELRYYDAIKRGLVEPERCGRCEYCRRTKALDRVQTVEEFEDETDTEVL